jgi:lysophospholipase L1-like esterase
MLYWTRFLSLVMLVVSVLVAGTASPAQAADAKSGLGVLTAKDVPFRQGETIAFLGDSITQGGAAPGGYCRLIDEAIAKAHPELGVKIVYAGISGHKVPDLQGRLDRDVLSKKPTVVFIYIGINDVWHSTSGHGTPKDKYEAGLRDLIKRITDKGAIVVLATPSVIGEKTDGSNPLDKMLDEYAAISRKVAADTKTPLCDLHEAFAKYLEKHNPQNKANGVLTGDGVHLNAAGNRFVARQAAAAIVAALARPGASSAATSAATAGDEGFKPIFDGKTLEGWDGNPKLWRVEDGTITGETTKENPTQSNTFLIWGGGKPADFELKAEFRMPNPGFANSGIQIRSWEDPNGKRRVYGYQPDMDSDNTFTGICYGENFRGILAGRGEKATIAQDGKKTAKQFADGNELKKFIKKQDWNEYDIVAKGNHIIQKINGQVMCELTDEDKVARKDGIIAFQIHAGPPMKVQFRNIRLKELKRDQPMKADAKKKIVFIAGGPSHGYADHEHYAGCALLAKCLNESGLPVETAVYKGWPKDPDALDGAATIVIFSDGGSGHPMMPHRDQVEKLMKQGVGLACIHYAVEIPKGEPGDQLKNWIGGYFETFWSVNPFWVGQFKKFPRHPVANGVKPFSINDEWYYHMRFVDGMKGVTPILTAVPPDDTRREGNDAHGANPAVFARKGMPEHVAWACQRPEGGRGFGFTGGHSHWNWACDSFRTVALNGIAWTAGLDVPAAGVHSKTPTYEELEANQDKPQPRNFDKQRVLKQMEEWKKEAEAAK